MRRVEWSVIHTDLLVGSAPQTAEDFDCLYRDAQVSAVLSLQHDEDLRRAGLTSADLHRMAATRGLLMARCPLRDHDPADQQRGLPAAVRTLHTLRQQGHRVDTMRVGQLYKNRLEREPHRPKQREGHPET